MQIDNISKKEYQTLSKMYLGKDIMNNEGQIFIINKRNKWKNQKYILKKLYYDEGDNFGNKLLTVNALIDRQDEMNIEEIILPTKLAVYKNKIIGFYMPFIDNINFNYMINSFTVSIENKISMLKEIGIILKKMKILRKNPMFNDFYLNDIHEDNFIYNKFTHKINVIDIDSCSIAGNKPFASRYLTSLSPIAYFPYKYKHNQDERYSGFIIPDENSDLFCYNVMVLNYLFGDKITKLNINDFFLYLNYLRSLNVDYDILDIFAKLYSFADNDSVLPYLDLLNNKEILIKSKKEEFQKIISKK